MKAKIIGRMIVLGTMLILAAACNPMASSFGVPDFLKGQSAHWYSSTASHGGGEEDWKIESGLACENAIAKAERSNHGQFRIKKFEVMGILKDNRIVSTKCRIRI